MIKSPFEKRFAKNTEKTLTGDPFLDSLHTIAPGEIDSKIPQRKASSYIGPAVRIGVLLLCVCVLATSLFSIAGSLADYQKTEDYYDQLANLWGDGASGGLNPFGPLSFADKNAADGGTPLYGMAMDTPGTSGDVDISTGDSSEMIALRARLNALKTQNADFLGWITIPDTKVDYPAVHTVDNEYYLNHSFEKEYLRAGSIFADYRNSKSLLENRNTILYGHNMMSGSMFGCISDFFSRSYFTENRYIYIYTSDGIFVYQTFAIRKVKINKDVSYITTFFADDEAFLEFANRMMKASAVKLNDVTFTETDRILTLSTCTNSGNDNERYCLQAKLVSIVK